MKSNKTGVKEEEAKDWYLSKKGISDISISYLSGVNI